MATKRRRSFDTKSFLAHVGDGQSIGKYRKGQIVFSQGDPGDAVFYIQKGKAKLTVISEQGKEAVIAVLGTDEFFGEGCGHDDDGLRHRLIGKISYYPGDPSGTDVLRDVHCPSPGSGYSR
jgi:CRP-like cAMP-binding protein